MISPTCLRCILANAVAPTLLLALSATVHAQFQTVQVTPSDKDRYAASEAQNVKYHALPANTPKGKAARRTELSNMHSDRRSSGRAPDSGGPRFPGDLEFQGGNVITSMQQHLIYVNLGSSTCSTVATCWGNPHKFLRDLGHSQMIHIVDQYTDSSDDNRYQVSDTQFQVSFPRGANPYTDTDMQTIVHAVVMANGLKTGYDNEYHIFLVPGQDECLDTNPPFLLCYSPDNPGSFFFCAYHSSADFPDIGHVVYSVEPFQDVAGCSSRPNGPNGQLADSTNNVLSHETFESITDPDGTAWINTLDNALVGSEIGDECAFIEPITSLEVFFDPSNVTLDGAKYIIQPEYNNAAHACTTAARGRDD